MAERSQWTITTPYEYDDWANTSWYGNFDWQDEFIGHDQSRYLGPHGEYVDQVSDTNQAYEEKALKPRSPGWHNWLNDQIERCVHSDAGWMELDNQDYALRRDRAAVREAFENLIALGIKPILKNPSRRELLEFGGMKDQDGQWAIAGCIFESGTMGPLDFVSIRREINPALQASWVRHGGSPAGHDVPEIRRQVERCPGTSVQWGPREYNGMRILLANSLPQHA